MKRNLPRGILDVESGDADAEMDVDEETKADAMIDDANDDGGISDEEPSGRAENPFMDSFYGISSTSPADRSRAAQTMLQHTLVGPDANLEDAAYALRRLLSGLCSGRAAARQGNASTLASFLKFVFSLDKIGEIKHKTQKDDEKALTELAFCRSRLLAATEPGETQGRKKGSEERDYQFGRLFGINGIVKSGILLPPASGEIDLDDYKDVTSGLLSDLADLYRTKKWLREPTAHAVCTLLNSFYVECPKNGNALKIVEHIVETVVVPEFLTTGDRENDSPTLFAAYSAEQIGIAVNIQGRCHIHSCSLPVPIDKAVLTKEAIPLLAQALSETSAVTQPRTHLVWDTVWSYISDSDDDKIAKCEIRKAKKMCPVGEDSVDDILGCIIQNVVVEQLLGITEKSSKSTGKTTHERQALALCLVRNLSGCEFISSLSGRTRLILEAECLDSLVFRPVLVQRLFLDVICAKGRSKSQAGHILKPLSLSILESVVESLVSDAVDTVEEALKKRFIVAQSLLSCEPRFDSRTKSTTVENLLDLQFLDVSEYSIPVLLEPYVVFIEKQIVSFNQPGVSKSHLETLGFVDLLFHFGKRLLKQDFEEKKDLTTFRASTLERIFAFLMATAFFDCKNAKVVHSSVTPKSKKKKRKSGGAIPKADFNSASMAISAKAGISCPYELRQIASSRFFSLVSDGVNAEAHSARGEKLDLILELLDSLQKTQKNFLFAGAKEVSCSKNSDGMETDEESPTEIVKKLRKRAKDTVVKDDETNIYRSERKWNNGCAILALSLNLHLLSCGQPDETNSNVSDTDEDEEIEEISCFLSDVDHVSTLFSTNSSDNDNHLVALAELCASILSSPVGVCSESKGALPTLIREAIKLIWCSGLNLVTALKSQKITLDAQVVNILLNAIGAIDDKDEEDDMSDDEEDDESESDSESSSAEPVFTLATGVEEFPRDKELRQDSRILPNESDESDLELDSSKLQSMLEEGSDADVDERELEHHEGADAALAKLIQLKQDARKAGHMAKERVEIARQNRCTILIETLVNGKDDSWGTLLRVDLVLQIVLPILQYRMDILKSLEKSTSKGSSAGTAEKRALLERLTALLKNKILKAKIPDSKWSDTLDCMEFAQEFSEKVLQSARTTSNKDHQILCSNCLIFMIRNVILVEQKIVLSKIYADAVSEWSIKKTCRLESTFFESLIHSNPVLARLCLVSPLAIAASEARSSFLKAEACRLITVLYNPKLNGGESEVEKAAFAGVTEGSPSILASLIHCLKDTEMKKTKRVREVLKSTEKVVSFLNASLSNAVSVKQGTLIELSQLLTKLNDDSESEAIRKAALKVLDQTTELTKTLDVSVSDTPALKSKASSTKTVKKKGKKKKR